MSHISFIHALNLNLRKLILILTIFAVSCLFIISLLIGHYIAKKELINDSLALNYEYAFKIANSTDNYFRNLLSELKHSTLAVSYSFDNNKLRQYEVDRLKNQAHYFNAVIIGDRRGNILNFSPASFDSGQLTNQDLLNFKHLAQSKQPYISQPYYSIRHNLIIFIAQPIFNKQNIYQGYMVVVINLNEKNIISDLLASEYGYKKNYMYVIDQSRQIIFHPDSARIGSIMTNNTALSYMNQINRGRVELINSRGIENLAGFARISTTNWIVVSQQPTRELLKQANSVIYKVSVVILLFYLLIFLVIWKLSLFISSPLNHLAKMASRLNQPEIEQKIQAISPWYYEVQKFKLSLLLSAQNFSKKISEMNHHVNSDPLTGLYNRRGIDIFIKEMVDNHTPFSILLIDVDYFKKINDTYGHIQGDIVLKQIAGHLRTNFRKDDICCRCGGEEFAVLMPTIDKKAVYNSAERLRKKIESNITNLSGPVTISIGIAYWPESSKSTEEVFKIADHYLYQAKREGRNCVRGP